MPLFPGPAAVAIYAGAKFGVYAGFAAVLNRAIKRDCSVMAFATWKLALGAVGGATFAFLLLPVNWSFAETRLGEALLILPLRLVVWTTVLSTVYRFPLRSRVMAVAAILGTGLSYATDAALHAGYEHFKLVPGFSIPFC